MSTHPKDEIDEVIGVLILGRQRKKLSINQVAERIGLTRDQLSLYENGVYDAPLRVLHDYARVVDMELSWTLARAPGEVT